MIAIIDYNVGNLLSAQKAFDYLGAQTIVTADRKTIEKSEAIVLPGVGAFPDAMGKLRERGLDELLREQAKTGKPMLGICLGMQLLFDYSMEMKKTEGLGLIKGGIKKIKPGVKVPHMGWNNLRILQPHPLMKGLTDGAFVYFVHSYCAHATDEGNLIAIAGYGDEAVCAAVAKDNVMATQFHPEKSSKTGLIILQNFLDVVKGQ